MTGLWTLARLAQLIETISGQRYSHPGVWRLLKGMHFSCRRPTGRAFQRDGEAVRRWRGERWPERKKTARAKAG